MGDLNSLTGRSWRGILVPHDSQTRARNMTGLWALACAQVHKLRTMDLGSIISTETTRGDAVHANTAQVARELYIDKAWLRPAHLPGEDHVGIH